MIGKLYCQKDGSCPIKVIAEDTENKVAYVVRCDLPGSAPHIISYDYLNELVPVEDEPIQLHSDDELEEWQVRKRDERYSIIRPLLEDTVIIDKAKRTSLINEIARKNNISTLTVRNYYWSYLVGGGKNTLVPHKRVLPKKELTTDQKNMRWALNAYYYTTEKNSLVYAYKQMLINKYTDENGKLLSNYPTFNQFHYFYKKNNKHINEVISRFGVSYYQRNSRPIPGSTTVYAADIGTFMTDSTEADIFIVNRITRKTIGRPNIYIIVDTYSELVAGFYVGFVGGNEAVRMMLINMCEDKVEYCNKYEIEIQQDQWPSHHLPKCIITDRGTEFMSGVLSNVCEQYDIKIDHLPAYRPDLKGVVEKIFDMIQNSFKSVLADKGVIRVDFMERGAPNYRDTAALDIEEFRAVVIKTIVYYNSSHVINGFKRSQDMIKKNIPQIPARIWNWRIQEGTELQQPERISFMLSLLLRETGKFTRKGLQFHGKIYFNDAFKERCVRAGIRGAEAVTVVYDPENLSQIWLLEDGKYFQLGVMPDGYEDVSITELLDYEQTEAKNKKELQSDLFEKELALINDIKNIGNSAEHLTRITNPVEENRKTRVNKKNSPEAKDKDSNLLDIFWEEMDGEGQ